MTNSKVSPLGDRHCQVTVSPRLTFITKALKSKPVNRLVALYAGFDCLETAERFEEYVVLNWGKTSFEVLIRPGQRTLSRWEVKVRRPTEAQLQAVIKKAQQPLRTAAQVMSELDAMPTDFNRPRAATYRGISIS